MHYDPIKKILGKTFNVTPYSRIFFYKLLDLLLLRTWHIKKELKKIKRQIPANANVLDGGMGFGQYTYNLTKISGQWIIKGVDIKDEQVTDCSKFFTQIGLSGRVKFEFADLTKFNEPMAYNLIISVDVMEHILEDVLVFQNFYKALKPGGILLISTPSDKGGSDVHNNHDESFIDEHVREGYNILDIEEKLKYAGFSRIDARYSYGSPGKISWKLSMKIPVMLLNFSKLLFVILPLYYLITFPFCLLLNYFDVKTKHAEGTGLIVKAWK